MIVICIQKFEKNECVLLEILPKVMRWKLHNLCRILNFLFIRINLFQRWKKYKNWIYNARYKRHTFRESYIDTASTKFSLVSWILLEFRVGIFISIFFGNSEIPASTRGKKQRDPLGHVDNDQNVFRFVEQDQDFCGTSHSASLVRCNKFNLHPKSDVSNFAYSQSYLQSDFSMSSVEPFGNCLG